jgi:hypothetical protein
MFYSCSAMIVFDSISFFLFYYVTFWAHAFGPMDARADWSGGQVGRAGGSAPAPRYDPSFLHCVFILNFMFLLESFGSCVFSFDVLCFQVSP